MDKKTKLVDKFKQLIDHYTVTNCENGFLIEISGLNTGDDWQNFKFIVKSVDDLKDTVEDIAWMPKSQ